MESIGATGYQPRARKAFDHEAQTSMIWPSGPSGSTLTVLARLTR